MVERQVHLVGEQKVDGGPVSRSMNDQDVGEGGGRK